jgi:enhancing lycopene biosynthesis protein 2
MSTSHKKAAIILSGCGFLDGSEIHETTLLFLVLARHGIEYHCFAPNRESFVISHTSKKVSDDKRNILEESARIARGDIADIKTLKVDEYDILALPGGLGAATNLSDYKKAGNKLTVDPDLSRIILQFYEKKKPILAICIAPVVVAKVLEGKGITMTLGRDKQYIDLLNHLGMKGKSCSANECCIDGLHKVYTCPGYMEPPSIAAIFESLEHAVKDL